MQSNEREIYGIQSTSERHIWIFYLSTVFLSSLIGEIVILVASVRDIFKLNVFILALIQHIAVCDLLMSIGYILPIILSLVHERWILGEFLAYTHEFLANSLFPLSNILVCALTTSKYFLLKYRLRTLEWTGINAHIACGVLWISCATFSLILFFINKDIRFDYTSYEVDYVRQENSTVWKWAGLGVGLMYGIPIIIVTLSCLLTLKFLFKARRVSRRGGGVLRWQGIFAVLLTGTVYCISSLPYTVFKMRLPFVPPFDPETDRDSDLKYFHIQLKRNSEYLTLLNVMSNFYIYCLTVRGFRGYIWSTIKKVGSLRYSDETGSYTDHRGGRLSLSVDQATKELGKFVSLCCHHKVRDSAEEGNTREEGLESTQKQN